MSGAVVVLVVGGVNHIDSGAVLKVCYTRPFPGLAQLVSEIGQRHAMHGK